MNLSNNNNITMISNKKMTKRNRGRINERQKRQETGREREFNK